MSTGSEWGPAGSGELREPHRQPSRPDAVPRRRRPRGEPPPPERPPGGVPRLRRPHPLLRVHRCGDRRDVGRQMGRGSGGGWRSRLIPKGELPVKWFESQPCPSPDYPMGRPAIIFLVLHHPIDVLHKAPIPGVAGHRQAWCGPASILFNETLFNGRRRRPSPLHSGAQSHRPRLV